MNIAIFCALLALALLAASAWLLKWEPVDNWQLWWRKWSTWIAAANATLWAQVTAQSGQLFGMTTQVPAKYQALASVGVFILTCAAPIIVAHIRQPSLESEAAKRDATK